MSLIEERVGLMANDSEMALLKQSSPFVIFLRFFQCILVTYHGHYECESTDLIGSCRK